MSGDLRRVLPWDVCEHFVKDDVFGDAQDLIALDDRLVKKLWSLEK